MFFSIIAVYRLSAKMDIGYWIWDNALRRSRTERSTYNCSSVAQQTAPFGSSHWLQAHSGSLQARAHPDSSERSRGFSNSDLLPTLL